jgi:hypothetical protein
MAIAGEIKLWFAAYGHKAGQIAKNKQGKFDYSRMIRLQNVCQIEMNHAILIRRHAVD